MKTIHFGFYSLLVALLLGVNTSQAQCVAAFDTTMSGFTVNFTNQATGSYNYIEYDFGDGAFATNVNNPSHTYAGPGVYPVCQYIYDTINFNCFDSHCDTFYLGGATCMASFYPYQNGLDLEVYNASLGAYDSIWFDFGDSSGTNDTLAYHTYDTTGSFTVCLSVFDNGTMCDSQCVTIDVTSGDCDADFANIANGLTVAFADQSTGSYNALYWDFGDGFGTSSSSNPSYTYFTAGTYEVCLYVYDSVSFSCESEYCEFVTVTTGGGGGACDANFNFTADELDLTFENLSVGSFVVSSWDFGDGSGLSFDANPSHTYAAPGVYDVCLTILNPFPFCSDTYCETITVYEYTCEPTFNYSFNDQNGYVFNNTTTVGNVTSVLWNFGDGNTSTFNQPTYFYNAPGTYTVCLTTFDGANECGKTCKDVEVYALGIDRLTQDVSFVIYPNPNNGIFNMILPEGLIGQSLGLEIRDLSGRLVARNSFNKVASEVQLNTDIPAGAYLVDVITESGQHHTMRMMVR